MKDELSSLIEVRYQDFKNLFSGVEHGIVCKNIPSSSIRLHFLRHDSSGKADWAKVAEILVSYISHYCFDCQRRNGLDELERNRVFMEARRLFRDHPQSGQAGELLLYFFIEAVLLAPQVLKKMPMTTSPSGEERKGSDGIHMRWDEADQVLEIIFGESKLWANFSAALRDAFNSMDTFHSSSTKDFEMKAFTGQYSALSDDMKMRVNEYVDGENKFKLREVHACLIGFDWKEYDCLNDQRRTAFVQEFEKRYIQWASGKIGLLEKHLEGFPHKHLRFEFFFLPFTDVDDFREQFRKQL